MKKSNFAAAPKQEFVRGSAPTAEETFKENSTGTSLADAVDHLQAIARGTALILFHISEVMPEDRAELSALLGGLSSALRWALEPADAYQFACLGDLNMNIPARHLEYLLERELAKIKKTIAEEEEGGEDR